MGKAYPSDVRDQALSMLQEGKSLKAATEATGADKSTIAKWAKQAGISTWTGKTDAATASRLPSYAETVAELIPVLNDIAAVGAKATLARLRHLMEVGAGNPEAYREEDLAKVVGAWTRAIHDLQLLSGKATESFDLGDTVDRQIQELVDELGKAPAPRWVEEPA